MGTTEENNEWENEIRDFPHKEGEPDSLKQELDEMARSLDETKKHVMRLSAELVNQKKRFEKENDKTREMAAFDFIASILPAKDSMETGLDIAYMEDGSIKAEDLFEGMSSTLKILNEAFRKAGIKEIDPLGHDFDPELHEAMSVKKVENAPPNKVLTVYQKGYMLHGRLIRPARVEVSGS